METELLENCELRTYKKDDIVLRQNEEADGMYVIKSGNVNVEIDGEHIATLEAGDFFGEMSLMLHEPRNATIKVTSDELSAYYLSKDNFQKIKEEVGEEVIAKILQRIAENCKRP